MNQVSAAHPFLVPRLLAFAVLAFLAPPALGAATPTTVWKTRDSWSSSGPYRIAAAQVGEFLSDGSFLVVSVEDSAMRMTRLDASGTILSQHVVIAPSPHLTGSAAVVASPLGEVYASSSEEYGKSGSVITKWDAVTGTALWPGAVDLDEVGKAQRLAVDRNGDLVCAGVSRYGSGMVVAKLSRVDGRVLMGPILLPLEFGAFESLTLDAEGNAVVVGVTGDSSSAATGLVIGKVSGITGLTLWGPSAVAGSNGATLVEVSSTNEGDLVLATKGGGGVASVRRLDGQTGSLVWGPLALGSPGGTSSPVDLQLEAAGGVYLLATDSTPTLWRLAAESGNVVWKKSVSTNSWSIARVISDGSGDAQVFLSDSWYGSGGARAVRLDADTGAVEGGTTTVPINALSRVALDPSGDALIVGQTSAGLSAARVSTLSGSTLWGPVLVGILAPTDDAWVGVAAGPTADALFLFRRGGDWSSTALLEKRNAVNGQRIWGPVAPVAGYGEGLFVDSAGDVFLEMRDSLYGTLQAVAKVSGTDGSVLWGPVTIRPVNGSVVDTQLDSDGSLLVLALGRDSGYLPHFVLAKYDGATGDLAWGPLEWRSVAQAGDTPSALQVDATGNVFVAGSSRVAQNGGYRAVVMAYSGADGSLIWGPKEFDDFGQGTRQAGLQLDGAAGLFITTRLGYGSWNGYPVLLRKLDATTGDPVWGPLAPVLPAPYYEEPFSIAADSAHDLFVAFRSPSSGVVAKLRGSDGGSVWSQNVPASYGVPIRIAFDAAGDPTIWSGRGTAEAYVRRLGSSDGSDKWEPLTAKSPAGIQDLRDLALLGDDLVLAGADRWDAVAVRLTGALAIAPPSDGALTAVCGSSFTYDFSAPNGTAPLTFSLVSGSLPAGLSLATSGRLSGVSSGVGTYSFRVQVTDATPASAERDAVLLVTDGGSYVPITATPAESCQYSTSTLSVAGSFPSYLWLPGGQTTATLPVSPMHQTTYGVIVTDAGGCQRRGSITLTPRPGVPMPAIDVPHAATTNSPLTASVPEHAGSVYAWSVTGGTITSGQGTSRITFSASSPGNVQLSVTETPAGGCTTLPAAATVVVRAPVATAGFFTVPPCRLLDTRDPSGPAGGPALAAGGSRVVTAVGSCGVPVTAQAVAVNVTTVSPAADGWLFAWPGDLPMPTAPAAPLTTGRTRAVNLLLLLSIDGNGTFWLGNESAGEAHVIVDVNGYFD